MSFGPKNGGRSPGYRSCANRHTVSVCLTHLGGNPNEIPVVLVRPRHAGVGNRAKRLGPEAPHYQNEENEKPTPNSALREFRALEKHALARHGQRFEAAPPQRSLPPRSPTRGASYKYTGTQPSNPLHGSLTTRVRSGSGAATILRSYCDHQPGHQYRLAAHVPSTTTANTTAKRPEERFGACLLIRTNWYRYQRTLANGPHHRLKLINHLQPTNATENSELSGQPIRFCTRTSERRHDPAKRLADD